MASICAGSLALMDAGTEGLARVGHGSKTFF